MNRQPYFNYIEEKLNTLSTRINNRASINLLDLNIHSETFFADLFNIIFNLQLQNINVLKQNTEGIDLIDNKNKILIQVSSTCTKKKIRDSLNKSIYKEYNSYNFKFISISKTISPDLRKTKFNVPKNISFNPSEDMWDIPTILRKIIGLQFDQIKELYDFVKKELGDPINYEKVESNLTQIINILAKENLNLNIESPEINSFAIEEKIDFNKLSGVKDIINDYKIFYSKLEVLYTTFDKEGNNKSFSIFQSLKHQYTRLDNGKTSPEDIFFKIIENVKEIVVNSKNYIPLPIEELELCINIIVVDAFMRCKIFKNPKEYQLVIAR